ncbi:MAG: TolC family protein [Vicinamibacteria bacterium]
MRGYGSSESRTDNRVHSRGAYPREGSRAPAGAQSPSFFRAAARGGGRGGAGAGPKASQSSLLSRDRELRYGPGRAVGRGDLPRRATAHSDGGKRGKRTEVAGALLRAARSDVRSIGRELSYRLHATYASLVLAEADLDLANEILGDFDRVVQLSRIRYERGELAGGELRRIETEKLRFLEEQVAAEFSIENARAELLGLLAIPDYQGPFRVAARRGSKGRSETSRRLPWGRSSLDPR